MAKKVSPKITKIINSYRNRIIAAGIPVEKMVLFGSYAKGTQTMASDIDVCVVSTKFGHNRFDERVMLMKLTIGTDDLIEPHPYNPRDLEDKWDPLANEINRYGIVV